MTRLKLIGPTVSPMRSRSVSVPAKTADPFYQSSEYRIWRETVIIRAGRRCEWIEGGLRCERSEPKHRLFADHIRERRDGGDPLDPANGQCLCGRHHTLKTQRERAARLGHGSAPEGGGSKL